MDTRNTYTLATDNEEQHRAWLQGPAYKRVVEDFLETARRAIKHGNLSDEELAIWEAARDSLWMELEMKGIFEL